MFGMLQGMDSGFGDDEAYNVYDKPWRQDQTIASNIYRPSKNLDKDNFAEDLDNLIKSNRSDAVWGNAYPCVASSALRNLGALLPDTCVQKVNPMSLLYWPLYVRFS